MDALALVAGSGLLDPQQMAGLTDLAADLAQTVATVQIFRTRTEMEVSVLNDVKRPTPDAKYWQAVREQDVMLTELALLSYEYRKNDLETQKLLRTLAATTDDLDRELLRVECDRRGFLAAQMHRTAAARLRELHAWAGIKAELRPHLRYGDTDVDAHQLEAMQLRFQAEASLVSEHTPLAEARNVLGLALAAGRRLEAGHVE